MAVCIACGTENRDKAVFCRGCATSMVALVGTAPAPAPQEPVNEGPTQSCPACQAKNPLVATSCKSCGASLVPDMVASRAVPQPAAPSGRSGRFVVMVSLALVTTAVGAWWLATKEGAPSPVVAQVAATAPVGLGIGAGVDVDAGSGADTAGANNGVAPGAGNLDAGAAAATADEQATSKKQQAAAVASAESARKLRERREKAARDRVAEQQRVARAQQAEQARRRAEEAERQKAAEAVAQAAETALPAPPPSVDLACAASTNFIAREVCRTRECRNPAFGNDPVCARFREVEAAHLRPPMF